MINTLKTEESTEKTETNKNELVQEKVEKSELNTTTLGSTMTS